MAITINGDSGISGVNGSAATPALQGTDTNTGISFGTDEVNINTGGTTRVKVDSSGRLGLGTSSPVNNLQVNATAGASVPSAGSSGHMAAVGSSAYGITAGALTNGNGYLQITRWDGTATNYDLLLQPNGGRVGIGTTASPSGSLIRTVINGSSGGGLELVYNNNGGGAISPTNSGGLEFFTHTGAVGSEIYTERARITSSGDFQFNSGYGSVATAYGCRAWVNFNGTGTIAIRASGNVSSLTDDGTGIYRVNFTTAMPDANYSAVGSRNYRGVCNFEGNTTTYAKVYTAEVDSPYLFDPEYVYAAIFR